MEPNGKSFLNAHVTKTKIDNQEKIRNPIKRAKHIVKKSSQPLDKVLSEIECGEVSPTSYANVNDDNFDVKSPSIVEKRRPTKDKKRERWLLTRKTWKYMTDAGRKLIPESVQNCKDDLVKIEKHFQQICSSEPRFILWKRKLSYPGTTRTTTRARKLQVSKTRQQREQREFQIAEYLVNLLRSYLGLNDGHKMTALLSSRTERPDQTASFSSQRPANMNARNAETCFDPTYTTTTSTSPLRQCHFSLPGTTTEQIIQCLLMLTSSSNFSSIVNIPKELLNADLLANKTLLKQIYSSIRKQQLHRYLSVQQQQQHSVQSKSCSANLKHSSSLSTLTEVGITMPKDGQYQMLTQTVLGGDGQQPPEQCKHSADAGNSLATENVMRGKRTRAPPQELDLHFQNSHVASFKPSSTMSSSATSSASLTLAVSLTTAKPKKRNNITSCGTQTDFIGLQEIKRLAGEYKQRSKQSEEGDSNDELERHNRHLDDFAFNRKSSIDNTDLSKSLSDTVKRYLRMARKKSVQLDQNNRFKSVNYDRNLRNIIAKGEINPPGMDDNDNKAIQTLDAWALITLNFIRDINDTTLLTAAHVEWQKSLDDRIQRKMEYEEKNQKNSSEMNKNKEGQKTKTEYGSHCELDSSALAASNSYQFVGQGSWSEPTSPTLDQRCVNNLGTSGGRSKNSHPGSSLLHHSSQFLLSLWHGPNVAGSQTRHFSNGTNTSDTFKHFSTVQKSKSSSNVGHFVTRKILRNRSKSQNRIKTKSNSDMDIMQLPNWSQSELLVWSSEQGDKIYLHDAFLCNLAGIELRALQQVALKKIQELNTSIFLNAKLFFDNEQKDLAKRRNSTKRKGMNASFFDINKKSDEAGMGVFGISLEASLTSCKKDSFSHVSSDCDSRNSITSLFRNPYGSKEDVRISLCIESTCNSNNNATANASAAPKANVQSLLSKFDTDWMHDNVPEIFEELLVPKFIWLCINYLEREGLHQRGLFRVSTSHKRIKQMRENFNKRTLTAFDSETCPHDVATLLKEFLRELPEPLICYGLHKAFVEAQDIRNRRLQLEAIAHLVKLLPGSHRDTLYVVVKFLAKVAAHCDDIIAADGAVQVHGNKMDSNNLATVFAPNVLRKPTKDSFSGDESVNDSINVMRILIDHYEEIFRVPAELLDAAFSHLLDFCPEQLNLLCQQRTE